jgi:hypothetical protein
MNDNDLINTARIASASMGERGEITLEILLTMLADRLEEISDET